VSDNHRIKPVPVRAALLVHQEGALALLALVGLSFTERGILGGLAPAGAAAGSVAAGIFCGAAVVGVLWLMRDLAPLGRLEAWQRELVAGWSLSDAIIVAVVSGLAEEALVRALLQPAIGLLPSAVVFAIVHVVPDRRLWFWPVFALLCGIALGLLFDTFGYPAAAAAHLVINLVALLRLRR
jgi:membrane protease YdiL (CAAX protease family)